MTRPELRSPRRSIARLLNQVGEALVAANSGGTTRSVDHRRGIGGRGILSVFRGAVLWRVVLIVAGLLVGPGGVSVFN